MAGFDESIVREYFELNGFLVRQVRKYQVQSRHKVPEEELDLLVYNPLYQPGAREPDFLLFASELPYVQRAVVVVKAWHTSTFTPKMLSSSSKIFSFLEQNVLKQAESWFNLSAEATGLGEDPGPIRKVLVLPGIPTAEPHRSESIRLLQERGIDGIISFRSMLLDIIGKVEINKSYQKSDLLQVLRILKNYDLLKTSQMDLFKEGR